MVLLDVNVLFYAFRPDVEEHSAHRAFVREAPEGAEGSQASGGPPGDDPQPGALERDPEAAGKGVDVDRSPVVHQDVDRGRRELGFEQLGEDREEVLPSSQGVEIGVVERDRLRPGATAPVGGPRAHGLTHSQVRNQ